METGRIIDCILILLFIISFYKGYKRGIFKILSQTISWICGMLFCRPFAQIIHNFCGNIFYQMFYRMLGSVNISDVNLTSGSMNNGIEMSVEFIAEKFSYSLSILLAFAIISVCVDIAFHMFAIMEEIYIVEAVSKILGGLSQCFLFICFIWIMETIISILGLTKMTQIVQLASVLNQSMIYQQCIRYNILTMLPFNILQ